MTLSEKAFLDRIAEIADDIRRTSDLSRYEELGPELFFCGLSGKIQNLRFVTENFKEFIQKEGAK